MSPPVTSLSLFTLFVISAMGRAEPLPIVLQPTTAEPIAPGWHERELTHDGLQRLFLTYVPEDLPDRAPVVVLLHGGTGSMRNIFGTNSGATREWPYLADRERFLLLVPNGIDPDTGDPSTDNQNWNDLRSPGSDRDSEADDIGFLDRLLDRAIDVHSCDPLRVYFTGASNGGQMTYRAMMELSGRITASAAFISNMSEPNAVFSEPARPVPVLLCHGVEDPLMLYEGVPGERMSAEDTVDWWIDRNQSDPVPGTEVLLPDVAPDDGCRITRKEFAALPGGAPVVHMRVIGGGHTLPSILHKGRDSPLFIRITGIQCRDAEAAEFSWAFFQRFSIPFEPTLTLSSITPDPASEVSQFEGTFAGGYPRGHYRLLFTPDLSAPSETWIELQSGTLDALGAITFSELPLPSGDRGFLRVDVEP